MSVDTIAKIPLDPPDKSREAIKLFLENHLASADPHPNFDAANLTGGPIPAAIAHLSSDGGTQLLCKVVDIGDWDMDANARISIAHGLTLANIRGVTAVIRNDADSLYHNVPSRALAGAGDVDFESTASAGITSTTIDLIRAASGVFDALTYNATTFNRGWILIWHTT